MRRMIYNFLKKYDMKDSRRQKLFLLINTVLNMIPGLVLWVLIGRRVFGNRVDWMICFIGYPAIICGYFMGMLFLFNLKDSEK